MPHYFFHVHDGRNIPDRNGVTLAGPDEARHHAITAATEALKDLGAQFWHHPHWQMHVIDEKGITVCDLRFSDRAGAY